MDNVYFNHTVKMPHFLTAFYQVCHILMNKSKATAYDGVFTVRMVLFSSGFKGGFQPDATQVAPTPCVKFNAMTQNFKKINK